MKRSIFTKMLVFTFIGLLTACASQAAEWGSLKGRFVVDGTPPELKPLVVDAKDPFSVEQKPHNESVVIGNDNALVNVVVLGWLLGVQRAGTALALQILLNGINILLDLVFVIGFGWAVAGGFWVVSVEREWQARFGPFTRFGLQTVLWVGAALLAIFISDQARVW